VDSFGDLGFAPREGLSINTNHFVESFKTFHFAFGLLPILLLGVELLLIPAYAPWLIHIEGGFCIVKRSVRSTGRVAEALTTR
jgi:hypothetical protein